MAAGGIGRERSDTRTQGYTMLPLHLVAPLLALNATIAADADATHAGAALAPDASTLAVVHAGTDLTAAQALAFSASVPVVAREPSGTGLTDPSGLVRMRAAVEDRPASRPSVEPVLIAAGGAAAATAAAAGAAWWPALRFGGAMLLTPLYSRLQRGDMMKNETRRLLYDAVEGEPGLSLQELADRGGAGWGTTVYHLQRLEQEGLVRSQRVGHHRRFFAVASVDHRDQQAIGLLQNGTTVKIATFLLDAPGASQKDVCQAVGISPSLAHKYLARMEAADLLTKEREWRTVRYTPKEKLGGLVSGGPDTTSVPATA